MRMQPRQFRIGELAKNLGVERFVVRFWEKEFGLSTARSEGGQRFFEEKDLEKLQLIKKLLYEDGLTIAGAKRILADKERLKLIVPSHITTMEEEVVETAPHITLAEHELAGCTPDNCKLRDQFDQLKDQLIKLKKILLKVQFQPAESLTSAEELQQSETQLSMSETSTPDSDIVQSTG